MAAHLSMRSAFPQRLRAINTVAVLNRAPQLKIPSYELKQWQSRIFHQLPSGLNMEVIVQKSQKQRNPDNQNPPLVFVHGSYHAAWCWAEHWLPFFSASGFDCYAVSLLGQYNELFRGNLVMKYQEIPNQCQLAVFPNSDEELLAYNTLLSNLMNLPRLGESDVPSGMVAGSLQTHAGDIGDFIQKTFNMPPVLLGHSFGGLIIQFYLANMQNGQCLRKESFFPELRGAVLVCSVPPSGNSGLVWRYLFTKPIAALKVTRSLAAKAFQTSLPLCRETFFYVDMEDHLVHRYQKLMRESSRLPLFDLRKLNASLPVPKTTNSHTKVLVLGTRDDFIVDGEGVEETGRFYGVAPIFVEGVAHDMMLDCQWEKGADVVLSWLTQLR